ncbi:hypothetical protein WA026_006296 [Henosepilachna vigintioctopunctata]|uniref:Uncharacterized protein n=1 Tax=Henosepilachna vigintioctopunctata TaxID=420089 RepID=A0AAW1TQ69_9CUCU
MSKDTVPPDKGGGSLSSINILSQSFKVLDGVDDEMDHQTLDSISENLVSPFHLQNVSQPTSDLNPSIIGASKINNSCNDTNKLINSQSQLPADNNFSGVLSSSKSHNQIPSSNQDTIMNNINFPQIKNKKRKMFTSYKDSDVWKKHLEIISTPSNRDQNNSLELSVRTSQNPSTVKSNTEKF